MPHTAYGLLKAIRNHTITSPDLKSELAVDRPNACNRCHFDKTLKWTADYLHAWYSSESPKLDREQSEVAASVLWLLKDNAASRALDAWMMGWSEAQSVSGNDWQPIHLAQLLNDSYLAVRLIARRSLQTLPAFTDVKVNLFGSESERNDAIRSIIDRWSRESHVANPALLIDQDNAINSGKIDSLRSERDDTPMTLTE